ncbi:MAG: hypothetical protein QM778_23565 [Myxococcales bacterium]
MKRTSTAHVGLSLCLMIGAACGDDGGGHPGKLPDGSPNTGNDAGADGGTPGDHSDSGTMAPEDYGTFTGLTGVPKRLAFDGSEYCALDAQSHAVCPTAFYDPPTDVAFGTIDFDDDNGCGIGPDGKITCWGSGSTTKAPVGPFTALSMGEDDACGIRPNGKVVCWGRQKSFAASTSGTFVDLAVDDDAVCALDTAGHVTCWSSTFSTTPTYEGEYKQVVQHAGNVCLLKKDGSATCPDATFQPRDAAGPFESLTVGASFACGLDTAGKITCWGNGAITRLAPPIGPFTDVCNDYENACARRADGTVQCWGGTWGDGSSVLDCKIDTAKLSGTLGGAAYSTTRESTPQYGEYEFTTAARYGYTLDALETNGTELGLLAITANKNLYGNSLVTALKDGQSTTIDEGLVMLGSTAAAPGPLYCTGPGSSATMHIDELRVTLANLHNLGTCPGTPVAGDVTVCWGSNGCGDEVTGTLEGKEFAPNGFIQGGLGEDGGDANDLDNTFMRLRGKDGKVDWGIIITAPDSPQGANVYCVGANSTITTTGTGFNETSTFALKNFSKLGTCPDTNTGDSLTGCVR